MKTKVQTNSVIDNTEKISHYSALELIEHDQFRTAILQILSDSVTYQRAGKGLEIMLNTYHLENMSNNKPFDGYEGYKAALTLLGITFESNKELYNRLDNLAFDIIELSQSSIENIANVIFQNWVFEIKKSYSIIDFE